jgi:pimeloyl-ACP methyl ester carboxylesterase
MGRMGRIILFDKRGVGLSDPIKRTPGLEERMEDARAVLDTVGARRAIVLGISEGAPMALLMAASHPARVRGLLLVGAFARLGWDGGRVAQLRDYIEGRWGEGATMRAMVPAHADDPEVVAWAPSAELDGASPGAALDLVDSNLGIDAGALLPQVHVPATVLHQTRDPIVPVERGRELGERLPGARFVERPGDDHAFVFDGTETLLTELAALIERTADDDATLDEDRFLTTALVAEDAGAQAESALRRFGAQAVERLGSRLSACFDGPARALRCARALGARRVGVHTGEVVRELSGKISGPALERALELLGEARADEIRVSRIVRDLIGDADILAGIRIS